LNISISSSADSLMMFGAYGAPINRSIVLLKLPVGVSACGPLPAPLT
jgi:hypothetical protein